MATSEALKQLASDSSPVYKPGDKKDLPPGQKERAAEFRGFPDFFQIQDGQDDIKFGKDTEKLWRLAMNHKDVYVAIRTVINLAFWVEARFVSQNNYDENPEYEEVDIQIIAFLKKVVGNQKYQPFTNMLRDMAMFGKVCGYAVAEKVWEAVDGFWICDYKIKRPWKFTPKSDDYGNLHSIYYYTRGLEFHPKSFVWAPWGVFGGNWLGQSDIMSVRHDILILNAIEKTLNTVAVQMAKRPVLNVYDQTNASPEEVKDWNDAVTALFNGDGSGVLNAPGGRDKDGKLSRMFDLSISDSREGAESIKALLSCRQETKADIKRAQGMPDDMGLTSVPSGSWAKAKEEFNLLVSFAEETQNWVQTFVDNQIIQELVSFNWPKGTLPEGYCFPAYRFDQIEETYEKDKAEFIAILKGAGVIGSDLKDINMARDMVGIEPRVDEIVEEELQGEVVETPEPDSPSAEVEPEPVEPEPVEEELQAEVVDATVQKSAAFGQRLKRAGLEILGRA